MSGRARGDSAFAAGVILGCLLVQVAPWSRLAEAGRRLREFALVLARLPTPPWTPGFWRRHRPNRTLTVLRLAWLVAGTASKMPPGTRLLEIEAGDGRYALLVGRNGNARSRPVRLPASGPHAGRP